MPNGFSDSGFPNQVWLGRQEGGPGMIAFETEQDAARWSAGAARIALGAEVRNIIGPVPINSRLPLLRGRLVPEQYVLGPVEDAEPDALPAF